MERTEVTTYLRFPAHIALLLGGAAAYGARSSTPARAYQSLIWLFCHTRGYSNDLLHSLLRAQRRPYRLHQRQGVLGDLTEPDVQAIVDDIEEKGYHVFAN